MQLYRVQRDDGDDDPEWMGTLDEAHQVAKELSGFPELRIELFDLATDKGSIINLILSGPDTSAPLRTWELTPRKGLKEIANGE